MGAGVGVAGGGDALCTVVFDFSASNMIDRCLVFCAQSTVKSHVSETKCTQPIPVVKLDLIVCDTFSLFRFGEVFLIDR